MFEVKEGSSNGAQIRAGGVWNRAKKGSKGYWLPRLLYWGV